MSVNRSEFRSDVATALRNVLMVQNQVVDAVYDHMVGDLKDKFSAVAVDSSGTLPGRPSIGDDNNVVYLDIHTFILYAIKPKKLAINVPSGSAVIVPMTDTSGFVSGLTVTFEDSESMEETEVMGVVPGVSITVSLLVNSYVSPLVYLWTEAQSTKAIDDVSEYIEDVVDDLNDSGPWLEVRQEDRSVTNNVELGGTIYRHETTPIVITCP